MRRGSKLAAQRTNGVRWFTSSAITASVLTCNTPINFSESFNGCTTTRSSRAPGSDWLPFNALFGATEALSGLRARWMGAQHSISYYQYSVRDEINDY